MPISSFKEFLSEENREVFFTYGHMNPPTVDHGRVMGALATKAGRNPYKVFLSQLQDDVKHPLTYEQKVKHTRRMFPKHGRNIVKESSIKSITDAAVHLYEQSYNRITLVVGSDRLAESQAILNKYNGQQGRHGFYVFENINVVSSGERDVDSVNLIEGFARHNDFARFSQGVPYSMSNRDAKRLFNDVRVGLGLKEVTEFKNHVTLEPVSEIREKFIEGELFNEGDRVRTKTGASGHIHRLGSNYVIVSLDEGRIVRHWLDDIELEEGFGTTAQGFLGTMMPDVARFFDKITHGKNYEQAVKYFIGLTKKEPSRDKAQLVVKAAQMADVDVRTLDKHIKKLGSTGKIPKKLSQYRGFTKEEMEEGYNPQKHEWGTDASVKHAKSLTPGEEVKEDEIKKTKEKISKEKDLDREKFDRMLDRARIRRAVRKNRDSDSRRDLSTSEAKGNPVAKNLPKFNKAVVHKDRKKDAKAGYAKHKKDYR